MIHSWKNMVRASITLNNWDEVCKVYFGYGCRTTALKPADLVI